jgi:hypothetical protein
MMMMIGPCSYILNSSFYVVLNEICKINRQTDISKNVKITPNFTLYISAVGPTLWFSVQRSGFDSRRYQIFWEVVGQERGPLSLVSTTEEPLGRKSSGSGLENRDYGRRGSAALTTRHPIIRKKVGTNYADKRMSLSRYSSLTTQDIYNFRFWTERSYEKRKLACRTLYIYFGR